MFSKGVKRSKRIERFMLLIIISKFLHPFCPSVAKFLCKTKPIELCDVIYYGPSFRWKFAFFSSSSSSSSSFLLGPFFYIDDVFVITLT